MLLAFTFKTAWVSYLDWLWPGMPSAAYINFHQFSLTSIVPMGRVEKVAKSRRKLDWWFLFRKTLFLPWNARSPSMERSKWSSFHGTVWNRWSGHDKVMISKTNCMAKNETSRLDPKIVVSTSWGKCEWSLFDVVHGSFRLTHIHPPSGKGSKKQKKAWLMISFSKNFVPAMERQFSFHGEIRVKFLPWNSLKSMVRSWQSHCKWGFICDED